MLRALVRHARACGLTLAFVTAALKKSESAARLSRRGDILVKLPQIDPALLSPADVYGGGDFELAAYLFQEALATRMGLRFGIPPGAVPRFHVFH